MPRNFGQNCNRNEVDQIRDKRSTTDMRGNELKELFRFVLCFSMGVRVR